MPPDDVHMNQIGFEQEWLYILREFVKPYTHKIYTGYYTDVCCQVSSVDHSLKSSEYMFFLCLVSSYYELHGALQTNRSRPTSTAS